MKFWNFKEIIEFLSVDVINLLLVSKDAHKSVRDILAFNCIDEKKIALNCDNAWWRFGPNLSPKERRKLSKHQSLSLTSRKKREIRKIAEIRLWMDEIFVSWNTKRFSSKVVTTVISGKVPQDVRAPLWLASVSNCREDIAKAYFQSSSNSIRVSYGLERKRSIAIDVRRMQENPHSKELFNSIGEHQLSNLLEAFCQREPQLGYIQGSSYLAAVLLKILDETNALIALTSMVKQKFMADFVSISMERLDQKFKLFNVIFQMNLPDLYRIFQLNRISPDLYLMGWCVTLFSQIIPLPLLLRIMDGYFTFGELFVYRTSVALLSLHQKKLSRSSAGEILKFLTSPVKMKETRLILEILSVRVPNEIGIALSVHDFG